MALGASAPRLVRRFVADGLRPVIVGAVAGTIVVWFAAPYADALLFRTDPHEPSSGALALGLVVTAAAFAAFMPARRIARLQPAQTLRD